MRDTARRRRMNEIDRLLRSHRKFNSQTLADHLGVTERTIRRDLDYLREEYQLAIAFDARERIWRYTDERISDLPGVTVTSQDRFALLLARQAADLFTGTPWHVPLKSVLTRIVSMLPSETRSDYERVAAKIRFAGSAVRATDPTVWRVITQSMEGLTSIRIDYRSGETGRTQQREVDPYALIVRNREWYLVAWDHLRSCVRTFFLPRIKAADDIDKRFKLKNRFNLDTYLRGSIDAHQSNAKASQVKLRFTCEASPAGEDFIWSDDQISTTDSQGRLLVEFSTRAIFAVERQVLSWGGGVEVLGPPVLRRAVSAATRRMRDLSR